MPVILPRLQPTLTGLAYLVEADCGGTSWIVRIAELKAEKDNKTPQNKIFVIDIVVHLPYRNEVW